MSRRVLLALLTVLVVALLWWLLSQIADEAPVPRIEAPQPGSTPATSRPTRARGPATKPDPFGTHEARKASKPAPERTPDRGRLIGTVLPVRRAGEPPAVVTVLHLTGEEIARTTTRVDGTYAIDALPQHVPLVARYAAAGFLTGYCCDVVLPEDRPLRKDVDLLAAPEVTIAAVLVPLRSPLAGVRVQLAQGTAIVGDAFTGDDGLARFRPSVVGPVEVRLAHPTFLTPPDFVLDLWAARDPVRREVEIQTGGSLEVDVVDPNGRPAADVEVWLGVGLPNWPTGRTDAEGVVRFRNLSPGKDAMIVARAANGLVGWTTGVASADMVPRVPLVLAERGRLVGSVANLVDGRAIEGAKVEIAIEPYEETFVAKSDDAGRFVSEPLPPGIPSLRVTKRGYADGPSVGDPPPPPIQPRVDGDCRARLRPLPSGSVVVTVLDQASKPIEGASVKLMPSEHAGRTAADGTCRMEDVAIAEAEPIQTVLAKRDGYTMQGEPPTVVTRARAGVSATVVLVGSAAKASGAVNTASPVTVEGRLLDPGSSPVAGASVTFGSAATTTAADGSFRIEWTPGAATSPQVQLTVTPVGPGLVDRWSHWYDVRAGTTIDLGEMKLRTRPLLRIEVPEFPPGASASRRGPRIAFFLSCSHADDFLQRSEALQPHACVSYDGTWLHLPFAGAWNTQGNGQVFVAYPTPHGLVTAREWWRLVPDTVAVERPEIVGRPVSVGVAVGDARLETVVLRQVGCGVTFDPEATDSCGNRMQPADPFASLVAWRQFTQDATELRVLEALAPGRWEVTTPSGAKLAEFDPARTRRVEFAR